MTVQLQHQSKMTQDDFQANLQGHLFNLPAGEVRFALGSEYRKNDYRYIFDFLNTQDSFLDLGLGTFPANSTSGTTSVTEYYGELSVPVIKDVPLIQHLNLELGYRWSDYKWQGGISTYKALADWGITSALRFRGGYQAATRAPNIAEMFQAQSQTWSSAAPGDPCGLNTVAPYGVNPTFNPSNAANARALCEKLMGVGGAATFYGAGAIQPNGNSALWFVNAVGNPNVKPEDATTYTAGFVFQPRWEHPLLAGFTSSVDWYRIEIEGMIAPEPGDAVYRACLSPASNPTFDVANEACQRIIRNPSTGGATATNVSYINAGTSKLSGVDVTFDWKAEVKDMGLQSVPGTFGVNLVVSTLLQLETQATEASPVIDWVGSLGPSAGTSLNRGAYRYRLFTNLNYGAGPFTASLRWRHLPTARSELQATSAVPVTVMGAERNYDIFDFSGAWSVTDTVQIRLGIDNLFNTSPVVTGHRTAGDPQPTSGAGVTEVGFYDVLGRQIYAGFKAKF
jgi:outer membrane receptor protein involved in Fe transport